MPQPISIKLRPALATLLALTLTSLLLAACGSSSNSSSTASTSASATTPGGAAPSSSGRSHRFTAVRECLQKDGITLPKRTPGKSPGSSPGGAPGGFGGAGAAPTLPKGVTRAQYEADLKKCGGFGAGRFPGAATRLTSPVFKAALAKFATCMRENGENVPAPNASGKGPIFSTKGLNTTSTQFKSAQTKCSTVLRSSFRGSPGGGGGGAAAPPSAG
jgi:hypothetical protein